MKFGSSKLEMSLLITLYLVLVFILVSMAGTYSLTKKVFGGLSGSKPWPTGMDISNPGFWLHTVVFAVLVLLPMLLNKN
uniref:Uncharacterized protein n=1 Tax=viral metagenome TaxID=1070528 RepID=A0A6C0I8Y5_9ZZZZ